MPNLFGGRQPARMVYGIARMLAQPIPTPVIDNANSLLLWITPTDINPAAPHSRHSECVSFLPSRRAIAGSTNENRKHTMEYTAKQLPPHSTPSVYNAEFVSGAPNTLRATAGGKYNHMQNKPHPVQIRTTQNCPLVARLPPLAP